jgi:chromosome segregation ATPase
VRATRAIDIEVELRRAKLEQQDLLRELDKERQLRQQAEDASLIHKEETLRQAMEHSKTAQETELKFSRVQGEKSRLSNELAKVQEQLSQCQRDSTDKIRNLTERTTQLQRMLKQQDDASKSSSERSQSDHSQEIRQLTRDFEVRLKLVEDELRQTEGERDNSRAEAALIRREQASERSAYEERLVELEARVRSEETAKFNAIVRSLSQRLKQVEDFSEQLSRTNQDMQRSHEDAERQATEHAGALEGQIDQLRDEKAEQQKELSSLDAFADSLKADLHRTRWALEKSNGEKEELARLHQTKKEEFTFDLERLNAERAQERTQFEDRVTDFTSQILSLERQLTAAKDNHTRAIREHSNLILSLTGKVGLLVGDVVRGHVQELEQDTTN